MTLRPLNVLPPWIYSVLKPLMLSLFWVLIPLKDNSTEAVLPLKASRPLRIVGSSSVFIFSALAAENFGQMTDFRTPIVESTGTGSGFKLFCMGVGPDFPDIVNASRAMLEKEKEDCAKHGIQQVGVHTLGFDGIVLGQTKEAPLLYLSRKHLFQALALKIPTLTGSIPNPYHKWSDIDPNLPDRIIEFLGPSSASGTRDAFIDLVMLPGCLQFLKDKGLAHEAVKEFLRIREDGVYIDSGDNENLLIRKLQLQPHLLGILSYSHLQHSQDRIAATAIEGVFPTLETITQGQYPISRPLYVYVKEDHFPEVKGLKEFIEELTSLRACGPSGYLTEQGLIPSKSLPSS